MAGRLTSAAGAHLRRLFKIIAVHQRNRQSHKSLTSPLSANTLYTECNLPLQATRCSQSVMDLFSRGHKNLHTCYCGYNEKKCNFLRDFSLLEMAAEWESAADISHGFWWLVQQVRSLLLRRVVRSKKKYFTIKFLYQSAPRSSERWTIKCSYQS